MLLYILTGYRVLGIVYLDQLSGARYTHISYHDDCSRVRALFPCIEISLMEALSFSVLGSIS